jgi:phage gpG-like protein
MPVSITAIPQISQTIQAMKVAAKQMEKAAEVGSRQAGLVMERAIKEKLSENSRHPKGTPTPSAPGSPPSIVTGALRASVRATKPESKGFAAYEVLIGPTLVYARVQELGGGKSNLPARPYVQPAFDANIQKAYAAYTEAFRKGMRGMVGI